MKGAEHSVQITRDPIRAKKRVSDEFVLCCSGEPPHLVEGDAVESTFISDRPEGRRLS